MTSTMTPVAQVVAGRYDTKLGSATVNIHPDRPVTSPFSRRACEDQACPRGCPLGRCYCFGSSIGLPPALPPPAKLGVEPFELNGVAFLAPPGLDLIHDKAEASAAELWLGMGDQQAEEVEEQDEVPSRPFVPQANAGSANHAAGTCRPCAHYWRDAGCYKDLECRYCHLCGQPQFKKYQLCKKAAKKQRHRERGPAGGEREAGSKKQQKQPQTLSALSTAEDLDSLPFLSLGGLGDNSKTSRVDLRRSWRGSGWRDEAWSGSTDAASETAARAALLEEVADDRVNGWFRHRLAAPGAAALLPAAPGLSDATTTRDLSPGQPMTIKPTLLSTTDWLDPGRDLWKASPLADAKPELRTMPLPAFAPLPTDWSAAPPAGGSDCTGSDGLMSISETWSV
eukprot:TRINITY_DN52727_c0_g1_i1.p1 TRINITY_DN52727_c0_g1~~TRINITY_DN52727_c0_g1_i1.p1  ORF type:complete len:396 (+),score=89.51 TRINITY_DN52727_c0_g1_i1:105-1292(+)